MAQQPFRDERAAALARVDDLERELTRARAELEKTKRELASRRRKPRLDTLVSGTMALATLLVFVMGIAVLFAGCAGFGIAHPLRIEGIHRRVSTF